MVYHGRAVHHLHRRKRRRLEPYPHPDKMKRLVDDLVYITIFAGPLMTVPQLTIIWLEKNASGVSALSWLAYTLISVVWLFYGMVHRDRPIALSSLVWILLSGFVVIGALMYG